LVLPTILVTANLLHASSHVDQGIEARAKGAHRIVVGTVVQVQSRFHVNAFGDRLIVSDAVVDIAETLKGTPAATLEMMVEGGTVGELTLHVSDMPALNQGDRAVLFLDRTPAGGFVPHGRGLGIVKLDDADRVPGGSTSLTELRTRIRAATR
jgi:hypothetical protein